MQVADSLARQEEMIGRIQSAHARFEAETQSQGMGAREQKLMELASGYDAYMELTSNLTEGTKVSLGRVPCVCVRVMISKWFTEGNIDALGSLYNWK